MELPTERRRDFPPNSPIHREPRFQGTTMGNDQLLKERRTLLPLTGIILSLGALLLVPMIVGRESREIREEILRVQVPMALVLDAFRIATAEEIAATRILLDTGDPQAAQRLSRATLERNTALDALRERASEAGPGFASRFSSIEDAISNLADAGGQVVNNRLPAGTDTAQVWLAWSAVTEQGDAFRAQIDTVISSETRQAESLEILGLFLSAGLALLALISAMVTVRMEREVRGFARESERMRREQQILLESSGEGVFGLDSRGLCTFLNPAGARLIGYPEADVLGRDLRSLILRDPAGRKSGTGYLTTIGFAGGPVQHAEETTIRRGDGHLVEAECLTSPILDQGQVRGAVVTLRDIGQRKIIDRQRLALLREEQSLREKAQAAERRAQFLAEASELFAGSLDLDTTLNSLSSLVVPGIADSCVIYLVDEGGSISRLTPLHVDPNRQRVLAEQLTRYPPRIETLIPPVRAALLHGTPSLIHNVTVHEMKAVPGDSSHESVMGAVGLQSLIVVPLRARGKIVGAISYGAADSGRDYGPADLTLAEDLSTRAALALDNARLYQQSQGAVRARNEVLGIVSHDLRNPLNAVRFGAQALLRHWPPHGDGAVERNQLGAITKAADRMHRLIKDLLDVAQIDAGKLAVEPAPVPIGILLEDAIELSSAIATERGINLMLDTPIEPAVITVDGERILQVFSNLLHNAIKFSPAGSDVLLGADRRDDEVVFRVRDSGRGIAAEAIPHVFDRFWRSRNGSGEGAGLGLAIARGIVESHGGNIWVESEVGLGSTFYFTVPLVHGWDQPVRSEATAAGSRS